MGLHFNTHALFDIYYMGACAEIWKGGKSISIKHHQNFYCWSESETTGSLISVYYDVTVHSIFNQFEQVSITFHMYLLP